MTQKAGCNSLFFLAAIGAISLCGCPTKPPTPAPPKQQTAQATPVEPTPITEPEISSSTETPNATPEPAASSPIAEPEIPTATAPPIHPESKERILLLATNSPILIDFVLTIDGAPHTTALTKLVDEVLKLADTDGDGRTMWKELCECDRIKYGQFGNLAISDDNSEKQIIDRYDIARDGVVDRSELPRFLTRNAGGSRPFSIRGTLNHRGSNRNGSATWRVIDADANGSIDADERRGAAVRLAGRDNDDDEIVTAADLNTRLQIPDPEMMADRRRRGPDASRLLGEHADWSAVQRAIEQEYGGGRVLRIDHSPFSKEAFQTLDANHDGRLLRAEYERLNDLPAQIVIEVAFGSDQEPADDTSPADPTEADDEANETTNPPRNQPKLKLRHIAPELSTKSPIITDQTGRLTIFSGDSVLTIATNDTVARGNFAAQAKQSLAMFDQNKDGYLEASEVPEALQGQIGRFEAIDADGDGKAYPQEIEAFLTQQQAGLRAQIHARATDVEDLLFVALDANHDERLDSREIQRAGERLAELDTDNDGELSPAELPESLSIVLARGSIENADALFAPTPAAFSRPDRKTPRWFTAMDANQDGVISRREFLGTDQQFSDLDRDQSGIIELAEIAM